MSQVSIIDIEGNNPQIPTQFNANSGFAVPLANVLEIYGATTIAGSNPVRTIGSGNNITTQVQISQAIAASDATKIGLAAFSSASFAVDANGFVTSLAQGIIWQVVTNANNPVTLSANNGYIAKGATPVNFILPASAAIGDMFWIKGIANLWTLAQNALQSISLGYVTSTVGIGGSFTATQVKDTLEILCVTANLDFEVLTCIGNPTII